MEYYILISWCLFGAVSILVLVNDIFERYEIFGFRQDTKFGSSVTGILWPITLILLASLLPFANLVWVVFLAIYGYNSYKGK